MPSVSFTVADFNLTTYWKYVADYDDDAGVRFDRAQSPSTQTADKSFTISGVDMSTINSIVLTWDVSASASGSITNPSSGYGYAYARVYQGASTSGTFAYANAGKMDLTSYVGTNTGVTCRFYYSPSVPASYYEGQGNYGNGSCVGTVYFKNVTLTVTYGEERDDTGNGAWLGVDGIARKMKNMYIGVDGVARKVKAAWIGDSSGKARLFYQSTVTLPATSSHYNTSGSVTTNGTTLYARNSSTGYAGMTFDGTSKFANFTKATLYVYLTGNGSTSITLQAWLRSNADSWVNYNTSLGSASRINFTDSSTGLHAYDITTALKDLYASNSGITTDGLKVYFRSGNNVKIAGHANTSYQTPYILLE